jgi:hypothetical protein
MAAWGWARPAATTQAWKRLAKLLYKNQAAAVSWAAASPVIMGSRLERVCKMKMSSVGALHQRSLSACLGDSAGMWQQPMHVVLSFNCVVMWRSARLQGTCGLLQHACWGRRQPAVSACAGACCVSIFGSCAVILHRMVRDTTSAVSVQRSCRAPAATRGLLCKGVRA